MAAEELLRKKPNTKIGRVERRLLRGSPFANIAGIEARGLSETYDGILEAAGHILLEESNAKKAETVDLELERLGQSKQKFERAMERLERAYLFDDSGMSEKDYLVKRSELKRSLDDISHQIKEKRISNHKDSKGVDFIRQASKFLLAKKIISGKADFISMAKAGDKEVLQDFVNAIIDRIEIKDKRVTAIHFIGGITHRFLYRVKPED